MVPLWQYFLENDLDAFRHSLADATFNVGPHKGHGLHIPHKSGSPVPPSTSPRNTYLKNRKSLENSNKTARASGKQDQRAHQVSVTRGEINAKDAYGRTLLHHAASSSSANALGFVEALLQVPFVDCYIQDLESGWTPLHRALYTGNIRIAQALVLRDVADLTDYTANVTHHFAGGLIKIKDYEGNSPFDVFTLTIASRDLQHASSALPTLGAEDTSSVNSADIDDAESAERVLRRLVKPRVNLLGDEMFAFGSNKNLNLGLGDEDDRQFPEQVVFRRPEPLLHRLHVDAQVRRWKELQNQNLSSSQSIIENGCILPAIIKNQHIVIQDVVMSKLHTAVLTNDPESNVYVCGFGPGGRLGTGDESTRFGFVCLQTGGLAKRHVVVIALGQDHSIAVCEQGEVFTWGSNKYGQLGYTLPQSPSSGKEIPMQLTPRQLFGSMKRELVIGAAASSLHSVIFTSSSLYTFGKNEGQLGLMDADARSLEMQVVPRRVGVSILQSPILMVSAIDRATTILLESHEVVVLTHYGWTKVVFQLESFTNYFLQGSSAIRYDPAGNFISKITSGGNTICAMSNFGEIFTVDVCKKPDPLASNQSTTNPSKARNALPQPSKLWSIRKSHMAARDVAVGQDGSIILCTVSGSVWRKEKRAKIKEASGKGNGIRVKDYKFARIPNINRAVGVRSNAYGAYAAIRKDCDVARQQIVVDRQSIWDTLFNMFPFLDLASPGNDEDSETENPRPRFWTPVTKRPSPAHVKQAILLPGDIENRVRSLMSKYEPLAKSQYDLWITTTTSDVRIPAHSFLVKARSSVLRQALAEFQESYYFSIPDVLSIEYGPDGHIHLVFQGSDFLTILNYAFYLYTDGIVDFWHHTQKRLHMAPRYRQIRTELMRIAASFHMECLEQAVRVMTDPARCLHWDMELAFKDSDFFSDADVRIELANNFEVPAHSAILSRRCPFFEGLFHGRARGAWLSSRRDKAEENTDFVRVDLKHVEEGIFAIVLRHIYADSGEELFDDVVTADLDEFIDVVIEVMAVSNELMLDRLSQVCQKVLGQFVTIKNICQLLNAVASCSVHEFKHVGLEYICLNLEAMLDHRLLEELDDDLLVELDEKVQENQLACQPFARSGRAEAELLDQYPELVGQIEQGKQRVVDSLRLRSRLIESEEDTGSAQRPRSKGSERASLASPSSITKHSTRSDDHISMPSHSLKSQMRGSDMVFEMDEEHSSGEFNGLSNASVRIITRDVQDQDVVDDASSQSRRPDNVHSPRVDIDSKSGRQIASFISSSLIEHPFARSVFRGSSTAASYAEVDMSSMPWHSPLAGSVKADFKDIMAQASTSTTSNLTLALGQRDEPVWKSSNRPSQKERKRIQHHQSQEKVVGPPDEKATRIDSELSSRSPKSPWQTPRKLMEPPVPRMEPLQGSAPLQSIPQDAMTMRQTVASASAIPKEITSAKRTHHPRSVSTPVVDQSSGPQPQIQSIRHTPANFNASSSPSGVSHSMADILAQQEGEKTAIKEAIAKKSLQEIQQEQEFQEWWDNEAKRVQEEEQASVAAVVTGSKGARGRGGSRRGSGRGGGGGLAKDANTPRASAEVSARGDDGSRGRSQRRARGRARGQRGQNRGQ